jgi:large subunit ribosomal protein L27
VVVQQDQQKVKKKVAAIPPAPTGKFAILKKDNLQIVEGIGAAMERLLNDAGIKNLSDLANTNEGKLNSIMEDAGPRYKMHDTSTWSDQAQLANANMWDELIAYQRGVSGGKAGNGNKATPSKVESLVGMK